MAIINLIGHFLKENGFNATLEALEQEHGQPIDTKVENLPNNETLSDIVNDRFNFKDIQDQITTIEKSDYPPWKTPWPKHQASKFSSNGLVVSVAVVPSKKWVIVSTSYQKVVIFSLDGETVSVFDQIIGKMVVKKIVVHNDEVYMAGMDGSVYQFTIQDHQLVKKASLPVHRRLIVDMKYLEIDNVGYLVTLGFDKYVKLIQAGTLAIEGSFELLGIPSSFDVAYHDGHAIALVGYNESTLLDLIDLQTPDRLYRISINDAEFITTNFSPRCIELQVLNGQLLAAIATSHEPYMRVIIVPVKDFQATQDIRRNQIIQNILTTLPQDKFSTPVLTWRKNGTGIWVLGDDGKVRGISMGNSSCVELEGHDGKVKLAYAYDDNGEALVTVGDDRTVKHWTC